MLTANQIRQQFLDFFRSKGHQIVPSAPIVVKNDPTLLFTNAGMNQFKDYFLGNKVAAHTRVADTQKCLRVSGKHNDLEEVGVDTYHHTMFEMLGNWSFGDYFKKEAIEWSWELLTEIYQIPKDRLYVTVFEGDAKENLPKDEEAYNFWKQHVAEERILLGNKKDNFWEMGDTGPCGPCSEVHVDCRPDSERAAVDGKTLVNADHPQVIEIWNNVFMQFNRLKDGSLQPLPAKHVDTGMGLERLVRVIQGKTSNYDTDLFTTTIAKTEQITGAKYGNTDAKEDVAFRVIADHIRAIAFTIADGQLPSNTGAGYVIRRILRRAVRYYFTYLNYKQPLLHQLMPGLAEQFREVFPELHQQLDFVAKVVKEEEDAFLRTLEKGLKRLDEAFANVQNATISGPVAFELYDTYGFPIDLTRLIAQENNLKVDEAGFEKEMQQQKDRSRAATALDTDDWVIIKADQPSKFVGYDSLEAKATVIKYRKVKAKGKESYQLVLDQTPFYAESGGQIGDSGSLILDSKRVEIFDTKKENDLIIHFAEEIPADLSGSFLASVNVDRRRHTTVHHSATHLLHAALREVLGTHVAQKGSLVNEEHLRFDFSHFAKMTDEEIEKVEAIVNQKIRENVPVVIKEMSKDEAVKMGAMALFGEKYGDVVRVVVMDPSYSIELCGGTHVGNTGELGFFKIKSEGAVAAGVRRIEAVSGKAAEVYINEHIQLLSNVRTQLKNPKDLSKGVESLIQENASLKKQLEALESKILHGMQRELLDKGISFHMPAPDSAMGLFIGEIVQVNSADGLKKLSFDLSKAVDNAIVVLCADIAGKASVAIAIADKVVAEKGLDAGKLIKEKVAPLIKGGGGGQKTLATAGGQDVAQLQHVIDAIKAAL
ncbi:alanine--tRNA ligase [Taibaiella soli]|uniref:Alanine--tRNA ligase n=1 Tax=Taibaiella soli TaxID=1649169 RepID=A0A2W2AS16_9BACT|nr:alanine--tRNA ligase [Taibaiella soli]PZF70774.1 alanine--tRNA ligase [Taibaiella soli]